MVDEVAVKLCRRISFKLIVACAANIIISREIDSA
jgi:hypothetical protein